MIFVLIASSYTPFGLLVLHRTLGAATCSRRSPRRWSG
jgi:predicted membrane channel-forming protein YqfA (hemolysin III family)